MATTPVPPFAAPPDFPALSDRAAGTYNSKAFAWAEAMQDTTGPNIHAIAVTAKANADDAVLSAAAAADIAALALSDGAAQVALAAAEAITAQLAANAATSTAGATQWVSGTTYTAGDCVWSPINQQVYRRVSTGAGTTDPSADAANWTFVGAKPSLARSARTSNTSVGTADLSTLIDITSGTFTQTFDAASTLGSGWFCYIRNSGTGDITLDPDGAETIDGLANFVMYPGEVRLVQCDGVALRSVVLNAFYKTFTASGTFTKPPGYSSFTGLLWGGGGSGRRGAASTNRNGGGGGGCAPIQLLSDLVAASESVVIGAGASGVLVNTTSGGTGGTSTAFGLSAFGGAGGNDLVNTTTTNAGGAAFTSGLSAAYNSSAGGCTYAAGSFYGGGSGTQNSTLGTATIFGGGGGAPITSGNALGPQANSVFGGAGGTTNAAGTAPTAGTAPGGGGGASTNGTESGAGARGELRIWGVI